MLDWKVITGSGTGIVLLYLTFHYLRSLSISIKELIPYIHDLQKSVGDLNISMATVIAEKSNDSKRIDELRDEFREFEGKFHTCQLRHREE